MRIAIVAFLLAIAGSADAQYQSAWNDQGRVTFSRAATDSTVIFLTVQYAPFKAATETSATFEQWLLRCDDAQGTIQAAFMSFGSTEADALRSAAKAEQLQWRKLSFGLRDEESARAMTGCIQLTRRKSRAKGEG